MKKYSFLVVILIFTINTSWAQQDPPFMREGMRRGRLAELEKIKLIETLQLEEETTLRFFSRRSEHMQNQKELMDSRKEMLRDLETKFKNEEKLSEEEYQEIFDKLLFSEKQMLDNRIKFYESLPDIMTSEQIAKLAVFEFSFMREIRKVMRKGRKKGEYE